MRTQQRADGSFVPVGIKPGVIKKGKILLRALRSWVSAGLPIAPPVTRKARLSACAGCDLWNPEGNMGFGECKHPSCGCSQFKAWLLTETCPHPKGSRWPQNITKKEAP